MPNSNTQIYPYTFREHVQLIGETIDCMNDACGRLRDQSHIEQKTQWNIIRKHLAEASIELSKLDNSLPDAQAQSPATV